MAAADVATTTTGLIGMWGGTRDGATDGFIDWASGATNVHDPKQVKIEAEDMRTMNPVPSYMKDGYGIAKHKTSITPEQFLAGNDPEGI